MVRQSPGVSAGPDVPAPPGRLAISAPPPPGPLARVMARFPGTVVACEPLKARPHLHIYFLVTLGSPLALP